MLFKTILALTITSAVGLECDAGSTCANDMCFAVNAAQGVAQTCMECKTGDYRGGDSLYGGAYGNTTLMIGTGIPQIKSGSDPLEVGGPTICLEKATAAECQARTNCEECNEANAGALLELHAGTEDAKFVLNIALIQCLWCFEGPRQGCRANLDMLYGYPTGIADPATVDPGYQMSITVDYPVDLSGGGDSATVDQMLEAKMVGDLLVLFQGTCPGLGNETMAPWPFNVTAVDLPGANGCCPTSGSECDGVTDPPTDPPTGDSASLVIGASILLAFSALF